MDERTLFFQCQPQRKGITDDSVYITQLRADPQTGIKGKEDRVSWYLWHFCQISYWMISVYANNKIPNNSLCPTIPFLLFQYTSRNITNTKESANWQLENIRKVLQVMQKKSSKCLTRYYLWRPIPRHPLNSSLPCPNQSPSLITY